MEWLVGPFDRAEHPRRACLLARGPPVRVYFPFKEGNPAAVAAAELLMLHFVFPRARTQETQRLLSEPGE